MPWPVAADMQAHGGAVGVPRRLSVVQARRCRVADQTYLYLTTPAWGFCVSIPFSSPPLIHRHSLARLNIMEHHHHDTDMPGMQGAMDGDSTPSTSMVMTFFQATNTPLLFHGTAPTTAGQYAGACIVLFLLAVLACALINMKAVLQRGAWMPQPQHAELSLLEDEEKEAAKAHNHAADTKSPSVRIEMGNWWGTWKATTLGQRVGMATYEVLLVGLGYVLMLAVMTMNVGYFLSVLAGIWVGTALVGAATPAADGLQHC